MKRQLSLDTSALIGEPLSDEPTKRQRLFDKAHDLLARAMAAQTLLDMKRALEDARFPSMEELRFLRLRAFGQPMSEEENMAAERLAFRFHDEDSRLFFPTMNTQVVHGKMVQIDSRTIKTINGIRCLNIAGYSYPVDCIDMLCK
jgi:hypothetical protein